MHKIITLMLALMLASCATEEPKKTAPVIDYSRVYECTPVYGNYFLK